MTTFQRLYSSFVWVIFVTLVLIFNVCDCVDKPAVPAIYVFGDSTADVGTNNFLPECGAKANIGHHGIDFNGSKPTGRFSNGYNSVDYLAQFLGFKESPPPYLKLARNERRSFMRHALKGANFASGGSGILDITGKRPYTRVVPFSEQVKQFARVRAALSKILRDEQKARDHISNSLFFISVGSNDIFEHFLFDKIPPKGDSYINTLLSTFEAHLRGLIRLGAKRIALVGVSPIGCVPALRAKSKDDSCLEPLNEYARQFNIGLEAFLKNLHNEGLNPMRYSIAKAFDLTLNITNNPTKYGFKDGKSACCGNGARLNAEQPCKPDSKVCSDRESYIFWDQFHPTEAVYKFAAFALYFGGSETISPVNINELATVNLSGPDNH